MLLGADDWYVLLLADSSKPESGTHYARIIAFEDAEDRDGRCRLKVWVPGNPPVELDDLKDQVKGSYFVNSIIHISAAEVAELREAGSWQGFSWS